MWLYMPASEKQLHRDFLLELCAWVCTTKGRKKNSCLDLKLKGINIWTKIDLSCLRSMLFNNHKPLSSHTVGKWEVTPSLLRFIWLFSSKKAKFVSLAHFQKHKVFVHLRTRFCQLPPRSIHSLLTISTASRQLSPCTPCIYMNVHAHNIPIYYSLLKWNGTSELVIRKCKGQTWLCRCRTRSTQIFSHDSAKQLRKFGAKISTHAWDENYINVGTLNHSSQLILLSRLFNWIDNEMSYHWSLQKFFPPLFCPYVIYIQEYWKWFCGAVIKIHGLRQGRDKTQPQGSQASVLPVPGPSLDKWEGFLPGRASGVKSTPK